jgi:hypothetical protein
MIEVGKTYYTEETYPFKCIAVLGDYAYMASGLGHTGYVWDANTGKSLCFSSAYDLVPTSGFKEAPDLW